MKRLLLSIGALLAMAAASPAFAQGAALADPSAGAFTTGDCAKVAAPNKVQDAGFACTSPTGTGPLVRANGPTVSGLQVPPTTATYTVGPTGQFPTVTAAYAALVPQILTDTSAIDLELQDGVINEPGTINWFSIFSRQIGIYGQHSYTTTLGSIVASSGSAGAWSYTLQLGSAANIAVGDYLTVYGTSGGSNPTYVAGVWPVTAVNSGSNQVTITTTGRQSAAASGAVAGTVVDMKSTLKFTNSDGFDVWNGGGSVLNAYGFNIVGDASSGHSGINLQDGGRVNASALSLSGFGAPNIYINYNSEMNATGPIVSSASASDGLYMDSSASFALAGGAAGTLVTSGNAGRGVANFGAVTAASNFIASGNGGDGISVNSGGLVETVGTAYASGNGGSGLDSGFLGIFSLDAISSANNATPDQTAYRAPNLIAGFTQFTGAVDLSNSTALSWPSYGYIQATGNGAFLFSGLSNQFTITADTSGRADFGGTVFANGDFRGNNLVAGYGTNNYIGWLTGSIMQSLADGDIVMHSNSGLGSFNLLQFGNTTSAFPAIKRNGTALNFRLADDSGDAPITAAGATFSGAVKVGSIAVGGSNACSTAGQLGWVTDATVAYGSSTRGANITGGGSNGAPAYCDGAHWNYQ